MAYDRSSCAWDPSRPWLMYLFIRLYLYYILYNKPINVKCFTELCELIQQITTAEKRVVGTLTYSWLVRGSTGDNLGLASGAWSGGNVVGPSP